MINVLKKSIATHYRPEEYPCLSRLHNRWAATTPLQGMKLLVATPIFRNTTTEYIALAAAGAKIIIGRGPGLPYDEAWLTQLQQMGLSTVQNDSLPFEVDIVLDCAGLFSSWPSRYGYVELTRSGVEYYTQSKQPVFMADSGKIKRIETVLGTGESYFRAMQSLGYTFAQGSRLLIFGSGKVGSGLILQGYKRGLEVIVVTEADAIAPPIRALASSVIDLSEKEKIEKAVAQADFLVMATGVKGGFCSVCSPQTLDHSTIICANMGVEDEFGSAVPAARIVQQKQPVNFILEEPTHLKYIDATLALHAYGAVYLVENQHSRGIITPPEEMEQELIEITLSHGIIGDELRQCGLVK